MPDNHITDTGEMAELEYDDHGEPRDVQTDMVATKEAEGRGIEFHVSMRDYTMADMEALIVEAAAKMIVGRSPGTSMAKAIEAKCVELVDAKAAKALEKVTAEIIDAPMTPSFGDRKPITMREFIGLYGREYLTVAVDREGNPTKGGWNSSAVSTRIELIVGKYLDRHFKDEIEKATRAAIAEIQIGIQAKHDATLAAEKKRLREALAKAVV